MRRAAALLLACLARTCLADAALAPEPAEVEQPRAFGHQLGDLLRQRVRLAVDGRPFEPTELPAAGRLGAWFERRAAHIEDDGRGGRWLVAEYQLINVPPRLQVVTLPSWRLPGGEGRPDLKVAAWPLSVAPLGRESAFSESGFGELRPDRPPPQPATAPLRDGLRRTLAALGLLLAGWLGWWLWRGRRERARLPFALAARRLRALADDDAEAWRVLHRAFDASAGRVVDAASLAALFERCPQFRPLAADIEAFYQASARRFFAGEDLPAPIPLRRLGRALRRIERAAAT